jgi:translocation protein SEC66
MTEAEETFKHHEETAQSTHESNENSKDSSSSTTEAKPKRPITGGWKLAGSYFIGWLVILVIFKVVYERYRARSRAARKKWFPSHPEKEAYESLLNDDSVTEEALRKALLRRAMSDIKRIWQLQEEKDSLFKLMRSGSVPESLWANYKDADQEMQLEIYDLQAEAETFKAGWSQGILKEAAQLVQKERELQALKQRIEQEERAAISDSSKSDKEKKAAKAKLAQVQKVATQMINKQYGGGSSVAEEKDSIEIDEFTDSESESESPEK